MMGVGKVTIVDDDRVEISNLNRQLLYDEEDLGMEKVNVTQKKHLEAINSDVEIIALNNVTSLYVIQGNVVVENLTFP
jgi:Dinucleotide-utilizing enzymes involved in molybdopterin and thiamine biosynthesis family 2